MKNIWILSDLSNQMHICFAFHVSWTLFQSLRVKCNIIGLLFDKRVFNQNGLTQSIRGVCSLFVFTKQNSLFCATHHY